MSNEWKVAFKYRYFISMSTATTLLSRASSTPKSLKSLPAKPLIDLESRVSDLWNRTREGLRRPWLELKEVLRSINGAEEFIGQRPKTIGSKPTKQTKDSRPSGGGNCRFT